MRSSSETELEHGVRVKDYQNVTNSHDNDGLGGEEAISSFSSIKRRPQILYIILQQQPAE